MTVNFPADLIDLESASRVTSVRAATIRTWIRTGKLRAWKRGYYNVVSRAELERLIAERLTLRPANAPPYAEDGRAGESGKVDPPSPVE